ncbi:MAG: hypothetical protein ACR2F8_11640 [Caulobacteraceae bacterium]
MTKLAFTAMGVGALALAACAPPHPHARVQAALKTIAALDCPANQGDLTRQSTAADGKSCLYADNNGGEVTLQLIALNGQDPAAALTPLESELKAQLPDAAQAKAGATAPGADKDRVDIDLPGIHIHANGSNDSASVEAGGTGGKGVTLNAQNGQAQVSVAKPGVSVFAADKGAEIRVNEPGSGVRRSFVLASDNPGPNGYKAVGYEARGPAAGPLVVASIKTKSGDHDSLNDDLRGLLRLNVGG